jgi:hypothetical protein
VVEAQTLYASLFINQTIPEEIRREVARVLLADGVGTVAPWLGVRRRQTPNGYYFFIREWHSYVDGDDAAREHWRSLVTASGQSLFGGAIIEDDDSQDFNDTDTDDADGDDRDNCEGCGRNSPTDDEQSDDDAEAPLIALPAAAATPGGGAAAMAVAKGPPEEEEEPPKKRQRHGGAASPAKRPPSSSEPPPPPTPKRRRPGLLANWAMRQPLQVVPINLVPFYNEVRTTTTPTTSPWCRGDGPGGANWLFSSADPFVAALAAQTVTAIADLIQERRRYHPDFSYTRTTERLPDDDHFNQFTPPHIRQLVAQYIVQHPGNTLVDGIMITVEPSGQSVTFEIEASPYDGDQDGWQLDYDNSGVETAEDPDDGVGDSDLDDHGGVVGDDITEEEHDALVDEQRQAERIRRETEEATVDEGAPLDHSPP